MNAMTRVLIVDDKEENLYYLRALLMGHGCQVDEARHGAEALVKARQRAPDLIVSDLLMPVMDGYTLLRYWKADPQLKKIPFIVYTATYTEAEDERLALSLGADAFILKPAEPEDFLARIREVQANVAAAVPTLPKHSLGDEKEMLKVYSETLIRKLEEKMLLLEQANQALEKDLAERKQMEAALRRGEQEQRQLAQELEIERARLAEAQQVAKVGSWETDLATLTVSWSAETHRIFETDPEKFKPSHPAFLECVHPEDRQMVDEAFVNSLNRRETSMIDHRIVMPDGRVKYVEERWQVFHNAEGRAVRALGTCRDITEKRLAELEVRRSAELLRAVADSSPDAIFVKDRQGRYLLFNEGAARLVGRSVAEVLGQDDSSIFSQEDYRLIREHDRLVMETGQPCTTEEVLTAAGVTRTYLATKAPYRDASGNIIGLVGISRDITERRKAQTEVAEAQRFSQRLIETSPVAIVTYKASGATVMANAASVKMLGAPSEEAVKAQNFRQIESWKRTGLLQTAEKALASGQPQEQEIKTVNSFGKEVWLHCRLVPFSFSQEQYLLGFFDDIRERKQAEEAVQASEERFRQLAENIEEVFYNYDPVSGRLLYVNPAFERIWGRSCASLYANPVSYLEDAHPEDRPAAAAAFERQLAGQDTDVEFRIFRPDGSIRWVNEQAAPVLDGQGKVTRIVGTVRDITERKLAAEKMRVNEERFQLLAKATKDAIWDWDLLTNKLWWGQGFETLFGFRREEVEPTIDSWTSRVHPEEREAIVVDVQRVIASGEASWSGEYRFRRQDGSYAYVLDRGYILRDAEGKAIRMIGGITDMSERREAEEKLRDQATLLDKAQDAILVRDLEHRILYWNKSAERLYGWTAEEAMNRLVSELFYKDTTAFQTATEATLKEGEWVGEIEQRTKQGEDIIVEGRWTLVRDKQGQPKSILAINTDITQRKKLEQQFLRAQRMESIGTLAGGIAHDLNNVLAPIIMSIDLLKLEETNAERLRMLEMIEGSASRGAAMVGQVLSFARGLEGRRIEVQARHLIRDIIKIANETFPKNIQVLSRTDKDLWLLKADPTQLHQVLLNLCVNARDAMPDGGQITITAENMQVDAQYAAMNIEAREGPYVKIEVEDSGTGIPKAIIEKIFDPFFTTKEVGKGTGLGLSTVQAIIKSHGGFIRVYSEPGMGAKFRIYLPAQTTGSTAEHGGIQVKLPRGNGETLLVVDDEASIRQITKQTLEAFGYKVLLAADGSEAVSLYVQHQQEVALVLTDMMMPVMDGPATIQVLKRLNPQVLIIGASGISSNGKVAQAAGLGVVHFLPKPYTAETLLNAIHEALFPPAK